MSKYQYAEDPFHLAPLWDGILEIYEAYRGICEKHGLRHYAIGGTLLGAVRHKGFIPWDDDFDVGMPRPDYEKFLTIVKDELPTHLKFLTWRTSDFSLTFGKIQDSRKERVLGVEKDVGHLLSNGIYIDIFPIDGFPVSSICGRRQLLRLKLLATLERFHCHRFAEQTRKGKVGWLLGMILSPLFPFCWGRVRVLAAYERLLKAMRFADDKPTLLSAQGLAMLVTYPAEVWRGSTELEFAGTSVLAPAAYDAWLRSHYGDYMTLPPESSRHPTHTYDDRCSWWLGPTKG